MKKLFIILCVLAWAGISLATDYYVAPGGSDGDPGTEGEPWETIGKANTTLTAGDTVYIRAGTYNEAISPSNSGSAGNLISYKAYPTESPVISRAVVLTGWTNHAGNVYKANYASGSFGVFEDDYATAGYHWSYWYQTALVDVDGPGKFFIDTAPNPDVVYVWTSDGSDPSGHTMRTSSGRGCTWGSRDYIEIDGLTFEYTQRALNVDNSDYNIFNDLTIEYATSYGIFLTGNSHHNEITNNTIRYIGSWYWDEGDAVYMNGHHNLVDGNDLSVTGHSPVTTKGNVYDTYNNVIQNNTCYDGGSSGMNANIGTYREVWRDNIVYGNTGAGIQTDSPDNAFYRNLAYSNGMGISTYTTGARDLTGMRFFHNTIYVNNNETSATIDYDIEVAEWASGSIDEGVYKNNIVYSTANDYMMWFDGSLRNNLVEFNTMYDGGTSDIRVTAIGTKTLSFMESNYSSNFSDNLSSDPDLAGDYTLNVGSTAIDAGDSLTVTVGADTGTAITVADASYFTDGFGIADGDDIRIVGEADVVTITNVDYDTNIITVDESVTWGDGVGVSLSYLGAAPDLGAYEYETTATAAVTGSCTDSIVESTITISGCTYVLTLTDDTWVATAGDDNAITTAIIAGVTGWGDTVTYTHAAVTRTSDIILTVVVPAQGSYAISSQATVSVVIPTTAVTGGVEITADNTFTVDDVSSATTGSCTSSVTESTIAASGCTYILTLTNNEWVATIGDDNGITTAMIAGVTGWGDTVTYDYTAVTRTSATVLTVVVPAHGAYDISSTETVSLVIPATAVDGGVAITSEPSFTVDPVTPALPGANQAITYSVTGITITFDVTAGVIGP